tara:strand:- start:775 stop:918 length:144 start_codon:yes stop_codon:yes gene_type:complete
VCQRDFFDEALFFVFGRAVIPTLGILKGVNNFIIKGAKWSNISSVKK